MITKEIEHVEANIPTDFQTEKIIPYLLLNSSFISNLGLFHGKMGIALFFAHYGRHTDNPLYDDFAGELLEEISEDLSEDLGIDFENGLCGIGWGIEYLVNNGFMEDGTDEILEEIDRLVMEHDPYRITDLSFRKGLGGILYYVLARLSSPRKTEILPFDAKYITDLKQAVQRAIFRNEDHIPADLIEYFLHAIDGLLLKPFRLKLPSLMFVQKIDDSVDIKVLPLGIEKGLTGLCFLYIMERSDYLLDC